MVCNAFIYAPAILYDVKNSIVSLIIQREMHCSLSIVI